ncbi:hypothetical protein [Rhizobium daejeonense]|uniref:hypothetical protein n=1 Tax=Rhizobium daejeonense TaxID=240521 RepID=UPI0031405D79
MNIAKANGIELAWDSFGYADAETILLISGLGTQMIRWSEPFCTGLAARGYRVIGLVAKSCSARSLPLKGMRLTLC